MKKYLLLISLITFILFNNCYSQIGNSPYPIIFVHGINSDEDTWKEVVSFLKKSYSTSANNTLNFVLNAKGGDTTNYLEDVIMPTQDINGNMVNRLVNSNIFLINFKNFWNQNIDDPKIDIHSNEGPGTLFTQSKSNESAIYKQGYALSLCIKEVLKVTGSEKVILVGHSMGGLAIREYLQRKENGKNIRWVDPEDVTNGHKVAKVVTLSTPHLGSNAFFVYFAKINKFSEAIRDLRFTYDLGIKSAYLFGNSESDIPILAYNNRDVNCNGNSTDIIMGINSGTSFNESFPLPNNINYTWVISKSTPTGDGCVDTDRQWLYNQSKKAEPLNITDTLMTNKIHADFSGLKGVNSDVKTTLRALDEPDTKELSYPIKFNVNYSGFITTQSKGASEDIDYYNVSVQEPGKLYVSISGSNCGLTDIALISDKELINKSIKTKPVNIEQNVSKRVYYLRVKGNGKKNTKLNSYNLKINFLPQNLNNGLLVYYPFEKNFNDYSGNQINGTADGNPKFALGVLGNSVKFIGDPSNNCTFYSGGDRIRMPLINFSSMNSFTISLWVYDNKVTCGAETYFFQGDDWAPGTNIQITNFYDSKIIFAVGAYAQKENQTLEVSFRQEDKNKFTLYTISYADGVMNAFRNSEFLGSLNQKVRYSNSYSGIASHAWYGGTATSARFTGKIDEFRIYNRALSSEEVLQLYNAFK
ncbi:MAG: LamG-like jellyroll fold domain-containing protein [Ignavibacteria bacterium]